MEKTYARKYTKDLLQEIVLESFSISEVIRNLKLKQSGGNHRSIKGRIEEYGIDTSHFTGQLWAKGKTHKEDIRIQKKEPTDYFRFGKIISGTVLRKALIEFGIAYRCALCNMLPEWNGRGLRLHVDHIDGNNINNEIDNLRFLCPNCHQQTETWGNKNHVQSKIVSPYPIIKVVKEKKLCLSCEKEIDRRRNKTGLCAVCYNKSKHPNAMGTKVKERPSIDVILKLIKENGYEATGRMFGVTGNAVRKWLK